MTKSFKENGHFHRWPNLRDASEDLRQVANAMPPRTYVPIANETLKHLADLIDKMCEGVEEAVVTFRTYEAHHRAKMKPGLIGGENAEPWTKAERNRMVAERLESLLAPRVKTFDEVAQILGQPSEEAAPRITPPTSESGIHDNPTVRAIVADLSESDSLVGAAMDRWMYNLRSRA